MIVQKTIPSQFKSMINVLSKGLLLIITFLSVSHFNTMPVGAQIETNIAWSTPVNLSNSGGTSSPAFVIDANGIQHAIWKDEFAGYMYSRGDGQSWSPPQAVSFPFLAEQELPVLVADNSGSIHAFWKNDLDELFHSSTSGDNFENANSWTSPFRVAESAIKFDVVADGLGNIHLAYIRALDTADFPSGVYYRTLPANTQAWSLGRILYASKYYRSITSDDTNIHIAQRTNDSTPNIYLGWDDQLRNRVYFSVSQDAGSNWAEPVEIDGPAETSVNPSPFNLQIEANEQGLIAVWQSGQAGVICTVKYRYSEDNGVTWSPIDRTLENLSGCPSENKIVAKNDNLILLYSNFLEQIFLTAWNGNQWSDPHIQAPLTTFQNPDTKAPIDFRCKNEYSTQTSTLYVIGCDIGTGKDIWLQYQQFDNPDQWFNTPDNWQPPVKVFNNEKQPENLHLVSDKNNQIHAFWTIDNELYYSRKKNGEWLVATSVLRATGNKIVDLSAVADENNRLHVVFNDSKNGEIFYSWADADVAINAKEWTEPVRLSTEGFFATDPQIGVNSNGSLYLVYSVSFNEGRGVYFLSSENNGATWSQPALIFDAEAAGWDSVSQANIATTDDGHYHMIFARSTTPSGEGKISLNYTQSSDGGQTWSDPSIVTDLPFYESTINSSGGLVLHRFWEERNDDRLSLKHDYSLDGGVIWLRSNDLSSLGQIQGLLSVTTEEFGRPIMAIVYLDNSNNYFLMYWVFENGSWTAKDTLQLGSAENRTITEISSAVSSDNELNVIISMSLAEDLLSNDEFPNDIIASNISLSEYVEPDAQVTPPGLAQTPTPAPISITPEITATLSISEPLTSTATPGINPEQIANLPPGPSQNGGQIQTIAISGILAVGVIGILLFIVLRRRS